MNGRRIAIASLIVGAGYMFVPKILESAGFTPYGFEGTGVSPFSMNAIATALVVAVALVGAF